MEENKRKRLWVAAGALALIAIGAVVAFIAWPALRGGSGDEGAIVLHGNVDIRQVSLAFNGNERIADLKAREGDHVVAGQVLGTLDMRTARLRVAQAAAQIGVQEQALKRLRAGSRPEEIAQARASVAAAEADADFTTRQVERLRGVRDATAGRGVAQQDLDNAIAKQKVARAQAESARKAAQLVVAGPRREDIAQAERQLEVARADEALLLRQIDEAELKAPIDAVVRARLMEPGDMASPQRPVYTLAITKPKWVRAWVPEPRLSQIKPGQEASVTTDSDPQHPLPGRIGYISSVAEFTPKAVQTEELRTSLVYEVRIEVDDPSDALRLGMPATVRIAAPSPADRTKAAR